MEHVTTAAWNSVGATGRDATANAAMDAYCSCRDEQGAAYAVLRMHLIGNRFPTYALRCKFHHEQPGYFNVSGVTFERRHSYWHSMAFGQSSIVPLFSMRRYKEGCRYAAQFHDDAELCS